MEPSFISGLTVTLTCEIKQITQILIFLGFLVYGVSEFICLDQCLGPKN